MTRKELWAAYDAEYSRLSQNIRELEVADHAEAAVFAAARRRLVDRMTDALSRRCWLNDFGTLVSPCSADVDARVKELDQHDIDR